MSDEKRRARYEYPDPTPLEVPVGFKRPPTIQEMIAKMVRVSLEAREAGMETFEEAEDFDVDDDFDPSSPWEEHFHGQFDEETSMEKSHFEQSGRERRRKQSVSPPSQPAAKEKKVAETQPDDADAAHQ